MVKEICKVCDKKVHQVRNHQACWHVLCFNIWHPIFGELLRQAAENKVTNEHTHLESIVMSKAIFQQMQEYKQQKAIRRKLKRLGLIE